MISKAEYDSAVAYVLDAFKRAGIAVTEEEKKRVEVADFGLGMLDRVGLQLLVYVNTRRCCAKEMVLKPHQTCPEHWHVGGVENGVPFAAKEETFRVRAGTCYLYVDGPGTAEAIHGELPPSPVTVFHEIVLRAGDQYTIAPGTKHWFRGGGEGAIVSEFSTTSRDESDLFTDERIKRLPEVGD